MTKYNNLIIDTMNIYYRAFYTTDEKIIEYKNKKYFTHGITGSLQMIDRLINKYLAEDGIIYFLFDNAKTVFNRKIQIDPEYKINRDKMPKAFYNGLSYLELILRYYRNDSYNLAVRFTEADDWVKPILEIVTGISLLISTDLDWARCISENVHWLNKYTIYNIDSFYNKYKYYPTISSVCFYKTFYGDKVDDIKPALKQLPFDYFLHIIDEYNNIYEFIDDVANEKVKYLDQGWIERILRDRDLLRKNWSLVSFAPISGVDVRKYRIKGKYSNVNLCILKENLNIEVEKKEKQGEGIIEEMFIFDELQR